MAERDGLYWLKRLEESIKDLEIAYDEKNWEDVHELIDELREILDHLRKELIPIPVDWLLIQLAHADEYEEDE
jgi:hypothetical protein